MSQVEKNIGHTTKCILETNGNNTETLVWWCHYHFKTHSPEEIKYFISNIYISLEVYSTHFGRIYVNKKHFFYIFHIHI